MLGDFLKKYPNFCAVATKICDIGVYGIAGLLAYYVRFGTLELATEYQLAYVIAVLLIIPIFAWLHVYESLRGRRLSNCLKPLYVAFGLQVLVLTTVAFITKTGMIFSRQWFVMWHSLALVLFTGWRVWLRHLLFILRSKGFNHKAVVIIGSGGLVAEVVARMRKELWIGFNIVGVFAPQGAPDFHYIDEHAIEEVWLMPTLDERNLMRKILDDLQYNVITIRYFPALHELNTLNHSVTEILGLPVINIITSPMTGSNLVIKLLEDKILASMILLLISPLMLIIGILIKLTAPGPILYRQLRHGCDGKLINIYKFRTMQVHEESGVPQATVNDPRVTKIGRILRRTSLDELPQFLNVLKGEMSIVGPRPHAVAHNEKYKELLKLFMQRHQVKPGITGWAQINGWRGETATLEKMQKRLEFDMYYINHWSLWLDLKIILLTIVKGFGGKNAY